MQGPVAIILAAGHGKRMKSDKAKVLHEVCGLPMIRPEPLAGLLARQRQEQAACLLGTAIVPDPSGFGRVLRDSAGRFLKIVEERDCTVEEKAIREVNPSCYVFELPILWDALSRL